MTFGDVSRGRGWGLEVLLPAGRRLTWGGGVPGGTEGRKNYVFNLLVIINSKSNYSNMMGHQACNYMNYVHGTKGKMNREDRKKTYLTHFSPVSHLYISLKTSENQRFCSFLFRGYRNVTLD